MGRRARSNNPAEAFQRPGERCDAMSIDHWEGRRRRCLEFSRSVDVVQDFAILTNSYAGGGERHSGVYVRAGR